MEDPKRPVRFGWIIGRAGDVIDHPHTHLEVFESHRYLIEFKDNGPGPQSEPPKVGNVVAGSIKHWLTDEVPRFLRRRRNAKKPTQKKYNKKEQKKQGEESNHSQKELQDQYNSQRYKR